MDFSIKVQDTQSHTKAINELIRCADTFEQAEGQIGRMKFCITSERVKKEYSYHGSYSFVKEKIYYYISAYKADTKEWIADTKAVSSKDVFWCLKEMIRCEDDIDRLRKSSIFRYIEDYAKDEEDKE